MGDEPKAKILKRRTGGESISSVGTKLHVIQQRFFFLSVSCCFILGALIFETSLEMTKRLYHINFLLFYKKWFLANWDQDNNTRGVHERSKIWKNFTVRLVRLWTCFLSVRVNKWFKKLFCGTHSFLKTYEILKMYLNISLLHDQDQVKEIRFLFVFIDKSHFKKGKYGTT